MKQKKKSLGRGLASILGVNNSTNHISNSKKKSDKNIGSTTEINISQITINPFQPRSEFNKEKLNELAASIKNLGIIQPITLRKMDHNKYQLISGERRYRASKIAGRISIPAFIRIANDQEMLEMALVENIQREDLNAIDVALSYKRLINEIKLTQKECSERVGKNRTTITNYLRLLKLPSEIQKGLRDKIISNGHAKALLSVKDKKNQLNLFFDTIANGYSVREVEQIAKDFSNSSYKRISKDLKIITPLPFSQQKMIHDLSKKLEMQVDIKKNKKGKGKIIISFNNENDISKIFKLINL